MEETKPKFGQRKMIWKPTAKKAPHNQGEMRLQLATIAQRERGDGLSDSKIGTVQQKILVSTVDQADNRKDCGGSNSLGNEAAIRRGSSTSTVAGIRVEAKEQF
ncbi:hypothetical protein niasHT_017742 [Heterodera trifolii]|uniref:Uncharacterized protein n=1 Tax=Heterodera trifolii TaxID=157864 RepID=A0ABD2LJC6_9BILA